MVHRVLTQASLVVWLEGVSTVAGAVIGTEGVDTHLGADGTRSVLWIGLRTLVDVC